jgi:hypothetical protein
MRSIGLPFCTKENWEISCRAKALYSLKAVNAFSSLSECKTEEKEEKPLTLLK